MLAASLLAMATGLAALTGSPGQASDSARSRPTTVVRPGDTLWSIALRAAPGRDPFVTINEIRQLNDIDDYTVHPGQTLVLPGGR